ncbi:MAG: T9SS type A sorting domain-containing protein [Bacteroidota bacterium]
MKARLLFGLICCFIQINSSRAAIITSFKNGLWTDPTVWIGGVAPTANDDIIINHAITYAGDLTIANTHYLTINSIGSLTLSMGTGGTKGSLTLTNTSTLNVLGGSLLLDNQLSLFTIDNGSKVILNTGSITAKGNVIASGSGGHLDIQAGTMTVDGTTKITAANSSLKNTGTLNTGDLTVDGGGTTITSSGAISVTGITTVNTVFTNTGTFQTTKDLNINSSGKMSTANPGSVTVGKDMSVTSGGTYTMAGGITSVSGDLTVNGGSKYTMTAGTTNVSGNMTVNGGSTFVMDGNTNVAKSFTNTGGSTSSIGTSNSTSTLKVAGNITNYSTINGTGWLNWTGTFTNNWGASIVTIPGKIYYGGAAGDPTTIPAVNPFSLSTNAGVAPLPIRLLSFSARWESNRTLLTWATAQEVNFDYFIIERSNDAKTFQEVGRVKGNGNSISQKDYSFTDGEYFAGFRYYRLKSVDLDGSAEYFKIISVKSNPTDSYQMYPNPLKGQPLFIFIKSDNTGNQVVLYNKVGLPVLQTELKSGLNEIQIQHILQPDIYYAIISTADGVHRTKLVVQ